VEIKLGVDGMSCGGCVVSVEKALARVAGVRSVVVSLDRKEATVEGEALDATALRRAVEDAGYDVRSA
jgi:copper chaperone CopZ